MSNFFKRFFGQKKRPPTNASNLVEDLGGKVDPEEQRKLQEMKADYMPRGDHHSKPCPECGARTVMDPTGVYYCPDCEEANKEKLNEECDKFLTEASNTQNKCETCGGNDDTGCGLCSTCAEKMADKAANMTTEEIIDHDKEAAQKELDELQEKSIAIQEALFNDTMKNAKMWLRVRYLIAIISKSLNSGYKESDIDWDRVDTLVRSNISPDDYNIIPYDKIDSYEKLDHIHGSLCAATVIDNLPWREEICKDCKKKFYISLNDVQFYERKGMSLPKRCLDCRKKRRETKGK